MIGATVLGGIHDGLKLFSIYDGTVLVPDARHQGSLLREGLLEFYNYPGGGMPVKTIKPVDGPDDAVVSTYLGSRQPRT